MDPVAFRLATAADIAALVNLRMAFLADVAGADPKDPVLLNALSRYFSVAVPAGEFTAYLAIANDQIIATSGLVYHRNPPSARNPQGKQAYIMNMYTVPAWRGRGIASELLTRLLAIARQENCRWVSLHSYPRAKPIYLKAGFQPVEDEMRLELR